MSGSITEVTKIKRNVYKSLASLALRDKLVNEIDGLPEKLTPPDSPRYRCCEYKEQAILRERIKLAMGFEPETNRHTLLTNLAARIDDAKIGGEIIQVLSIACDSCPIDKFLVTDACRNCVAHSCVNACPKDAIIIIQNRAFIDQGKCIECGRCKEACPFGAIHENSRPCERACAVGAIQADSNRRASIDYEKCIGCGSCIISCPFGAIGDKTWIVQVVNMLKNPEQKVIALLAPSIVGQFGAKISPEKIKAALLQMGFEEVYETALGADMVALNETLELMERIEAKEPFMTSSCCPSFMELIVKHYPHFLDKVSKSASPMTALGRYVKQNEPEAKVVFIGPCISKKIEAQKEESIDAVLTFEELACIMVSMGINLAEQENEVEFKDASVGGRSFAYSGGLTGAIKDILKEKGCEDLFKPYSADGLRDCINILNKFNKGEKEFNFIEGMGCQGGCVAGPGTMMNSKVITKLVQKFASESLWSNAIKNVKAKEKKDLLGQKIDRE